MSRDIIEETENELRERERLASNERRRLHRKLDKEMADDPQIQEFNRLVEEKTQETLDAGDKFRSYCISEFKDIFFIDNADNSVARYISITEDLDYHCGIILDNGVILSMPTLDIFTTGSNLQNFKLQELRNLDFNNFNVSDWVDFINNGDFWQAFREEIKTSIPTEIDYISGRVDDSMHIATNQLKRLEKIGKFYNFFRFSQNTKKYKKYLSLLDRTNLNIKAYDLAKNTIENLLLSINRSAVKASRINELLESDEYKNYVNLSLELKKLMAKRKRYINKYLRNSPIMQRIKEIRGTKFKEGVIEQLISDDVEIDARTAFELGMSSVDPNNSNTRNKIYSRVREVILGGNDDSDSESENGENTEE